ncbi:MAG: UDP-N-acetylmuramoyl-L-alanine--D-glutamate ligase [Bacilli bacterium]|jgi:UDP-N-acetylmuramoylalanine--D-glutamate ligase|nr:UDP-N-acetylmuramoyl-L-alanine--D-glutamate ligase [Bacilli bacterium]
MIEQIVNKLKDKKIALLGFGREGKSTYHFIRTYLKDQMLTILDKNPIQDEKLTKDDYLNLIIGEDYLDSLNDYDLIIKTPGITLKDIDITMIQDKITSQMELFLEVNRKNVIGVTGTKGKSTTSSLIYEMIKDQNKNCILAGNIGIPLFDVLKDSNNETLFVLEMSSHQLEYLKVSPHIGLILNLFEDHLDHAGSVEHYHMIKLNMFKFQTKEDVRIYSSYNKTLASKVLENYYLSQVYRINLEDSKSDVYQKQNEIYFHNKKIYDTTLKRNLLGDHNLENIVFALTVIEILHLDNEKAIRVANQFNTLSYRLENIGKIEDVTYYMSMLSTIPEATINDIEALENVNTLIFGGMDRGISYDKLIDYLKKSCIEHFICMPTTGHKIAEFLPKEKVFLVNTLKEAVDMAKKVTKKNTLCLLSPAASSYEQFKNYEEKGDKFREYVTQLN